MNLYCENKKDLFIFKLPGKSISRKSYLTLGVLNDRKIENGIQINEFEEIDYLIVKKPIYKIIANDSKINFEQITIEQLPAYLSAWKSMHFLGTKAIEDERREDYLEEKHISQKLECSKDFKISYVNDNFSQEGIDLLIQWVMNSNVSFCALLGDYGMGKTFLCRMFVRALLERKKEDPDLPVPLYLDMRVLPTWQEGYIPSLEEMLKVITKKAGFSDISVKGIVAAVHRGHVVLVFDGFDEKAVHLTNAQSIELLRNIRSAYPPKSKSKILLACRTHYFVNQLDEKEKVVGGITLQTRDGYSHTDFLILYLQPFDEKRIRLFLEKFLPKRSDEAFSFLKSVHDLTDLAKRPYLLSLITTHLSQLELLSKKEDKIGIVDVYESAVKEWIARDEEKHLLFPDLKVRFMEELAYQLWQKSKQKLHFSHLRDWLFNQIKGRFPLYRLEDLWRIDADLRTATFLVRDSDGNYCFAHRSFLEFFLARNIAYGISKQNLAILALPRLSPEIIEFVVNLINRLFSSIVSSQETIKRILEYSYVPLMSENALLIKIVWNKFWPHTSPVINNYYLEGANLSGIDLSNIKLLSANLKGADLREANLSGATLSGELIGANLNKVKGRRINLIKANLKGASLHGAGFSEGKLISCNFTEAKGTSIFFQRADFKNSIFHKTHFKYARLFKSKISKDQMKNIDLYRTSMPNIKSNKLKIVLQTGHTDYVCSIKFSPDGNILASGGRDNNIKIWEIETKKEIVTLSNHKDSIESVSFSPDGKILASGSKDNTIKLWDIRLTAK
ncbi:MAG: pentapeptide repeat-containing protein [bacterium]|nr:pentapeptide repeat-containing protein [bacterium]